MTEKQTEIKDMPERTPLGKKAIEYLNAKDELLKQEIQEMKRVMQFSRHRTEDIS